MLHNPSEGRPCPRSGNSMMTLTVSADGSRAAIVLAGRPRHGGVAQLVDTVHRLSFAVPETVTVDIAAARLVCSVLPNFPVRSPPDGAFHFDSVAVLDRRQR